MVVPLLCPENAWVKLIPSAESITWKLAEWNEEYAESGYQEGQKVFQQFNPWYGESKKGASKFKQFIDPLIQEGLITTCNILYSFNFSACCIIID